MVYKNQLNTVQMLAGNKAQVKKKLKIGTEFQFIYCSLGFAKKRGVSSVSRKESDSIPDPELAS